MIQPRYINKKFMTKVLYMHNICKEKDIDCFSLIYNYNDHNLTKNNTSDQTKNYRFLSKS